MLILSVYIYFVFVSNLNKELSVSALSDGVAMT